MRSLVRARWRQRAGALAGLAVLVGLAGAVTLFALAGARRTDSALPRLLQAIDASHAIIQVPQTDPERLARVEALESVGGLARFATVFVAPAADIAHSPLDVAAFAAVDGRFGRDQDKARVLAGRLPDPDREQEVAVSEALARRLGVGVGDPLPLQSLSPAQLEGLSGDGSGDVAGPRLTATVTGVVRLDFVDLVGGPAESLLLTPAFWSTYGGEVAGFDNAATVRLKGGRADFDAFASAVHDIYQGSDELFVQPVGTELDRIRAPLDVQVSGLLLFAVIALMSGLVAAGQAAARLLAFNAEEEPVLVALGMTRANRVWASVLGLAPALAGGAVLAIVGAVAASPLLPFGLGRSLEPAPGFYADLTVLVLGALATVVLLGAVVAASATRAKDSPARGAKRAAARVTSVAHKLRLSPPGVVGMTLAFQTSSGRWSIGVRPALAGTVVGIVGVAGALVFSAGLERLLDSPPRYGWAWDLAVGPGDDIDEGTLSQAAEELGADPDVSAFSLARFTSVPLAAEETQVVALDPVKGNVGLTLLAGRPATTPDEVVAGSATLSRLGAGLGETIEAPGPAGPVQLRVVGTALFPPLEVDEPTDGLAVTTGGLARLSHSGGFPSFLVRVRAGADQGPVYERLAARFPQVQDEVKPAQVGNLAQVRHLPALLAGFLALLGTAALVHTLLGAVRRRRRDLAVLKALGFTRRDTGATVNWQASALAAAGILVGLVLGVVAGRWAWALVARSIGVAGDAIVPVGVVALVAPAALLVANLVAVLPARAASRTAPAQALRTE